MSTMMEKEAREAPFVVERQLRENVGVWTALSERLRREKVPFAVSIARGSSDHAATFLKYILEVYFGIPTCSAAPSVLTVYQKTLRLNQALVLGISQSGKSPDIVEMMKSARDSGAITVSILNCVDSPLAEVSEYVIPIWGGVEEAVAATKSYLGSLSAILQFIAIYQEDASLKRALEQLPLAMNEALSQDWTALSEGLTKETDAVILGRGFGYPIAQETALKLKETSALHAEAFSSAEFLHGPMGMIREGFPALLYLQNDATLAGSLTTAERILKAKARVFAACPQGLITSSQNFQGEILSLPKSLHFLTDPLVAIQAFYRMAAGLSLARGLNPDQPPLLKKVTETR